MPNQRTGNLKLETKSLNLLCNTQATISIYFGEYIDYEDNILLRFYVYIIEN